MRAASRARGAGMVLALQGLGSCPFLSPNLVCIPPPPAAVKADGVADTALKSRAIALPLSRAARAVRPNERAPLRGWAAQPTRGGGGRTEEHRRRRADERARRKRAKRGARDNHVQAPDRNERTPKGCARDGRFRQAGPQFAQANGVIKIRGQAHANV